MVETEKVLAGFEEITPQNECEKETLDVIKSALNKQIPLKPNRPKRTGMGYDYEDYSCAACNYFLGHQPDVEIRLSRGKIPAKYCPRCGQLIDWGVENE